MFEAAHCDLGTMAAITLATKAVMKAVCGEDDAAVKIHYLLLSNFLSGL